MLNAHPHVVKVAYITHDGRREEIHGQLLKAPLKYAFVHKVIQ